MQGSNAVAITKPPPKEGAICKERMCGEANFDRN